MVLRKSRLFYLVSVLAVIAFSLVLYVYADNFGDGSEYPGNGRDVTARQAYRMWESDPENVIILDVRTPEEYTQIGHPPMAYNIPFTILVGESDLSKRNYTMRQNPDFLNSVEKRFSRDDTILLLCRSGQRSGVAERILRNAGFSNVHNIADGFEGNPPRGKTRMPYGRDAEPGWKNSGAPWTYELVPNQVYAP